MSCALTRATPRATPCSGSRTSSALGRRATLPTTRSPSRLSIALGSSIHRIPPPRAHSDRSRWPGTGSAKRWFADGKRCDSLRTRPATMASSATRSSSSAATTKRSAPFDRMSSLRPDLSSYSRVSYARELLGRPDAAKQAMTLALDAAGGQPEPTAWVETQLGKLAWSRGRVGEAESHYRAALSVFPGYVYALEPLALVQEAKGRHRDALSLAQRARPGATASADRRDGWRPLRPTRPSARGAAAVRAR